MARLTIEEVRNLCQDALRSLGYSSNEAIIISDHLVDAQLRGHPFAGIARTLSIIETVQSLAKSTANSIKITRSAPAFAHIDGGDAVGYLVAHRATTIAIEKARQTGISLVGANGMWYTGNLSYYAEMAAKEGLVTLIASNGSPIVAPHGGCEPKFCTHPFCIGFSTGDRDQPVIWDIGTSRIMFAQAVLGQRLGARLPEDVAFDSSGKPTTDPCEVLDGALAA